MNVTNKTPRKTIPSPGTKSQVLEKNLLITQNNKKCRSSLLWGSINSCLLGLLIYDLSYACPLYTTYIQYAEYAGVIILTINILFHFCRYFYITIQTDRMVKLFNAKSSKPLQNLSSPIATPKSYDSLFVKSFMKTPDNSLNLSSTQMDQSALSWNSNISVNNTPNSSVASPSWVYYRGSMPSEQKSFDGSPLYMPYTPPHIPDNSGVEFINDENSLNKYLQDYEAYEKASKINTPIEQPSNLLSSFWSHPATQTSNEVSPFLRRCQYQLSTQSPISATSVTSSPGSNKLEEASSIITAQNQSFEVWRRLHVDSLALTQWNANLRMWISQTILERLVQEIKLVDDSLHKYGLTDVSVGSVSLDRLRKTAQTLPVIQCVPTLPALIPFLELSQHQQYLVKRIQELSKGGCMSEYKWNGGGNYNGKPWDETLPSDSTLIMHLLASYLDTQLMPLPNQPDVKPFNGYHYIKSTDKVPSTSPSTLAIHQVSEKPPHFRFIIGEEIYELPKGHNNLFHTILLFLYHVEKKEHGMLGRVNLGRSGVNMLWILSQ